MELGKDVFDVPKNFPSVGKKKENCIDIKLKRKFHYVLIRIVSISLGNAKRKVYVSQLFFAGMDWVHVALLLDINGE
ncbi:hypothetical protein CEXT_179881 [Caerostris extrusa]|uniref:Uncharacterized protein n=1 Tax=Caerostris extrusa TaxID=172846 RepID=A0AAV4NKR3_CAEEX|nr:hypothetical protein CEXT_179881 [Caerostris extrusa]